MRTWLTVTLVVLSPLLGAAQVNAQSLPGAVQSLFLGQRLCGDTRDICYAAVPFAAHRFLHIVLHSVPGDTDWRVQAAPACGEPMLDIAGGAEVPQSGYLETILDLTATNPVGYQRQLCLAFRGHSHYYVNYYAAYLDDARAPDAETLYPGYQNLAGRPDLPDLDVTYIHRSPAYPYDAAQNQPRAGQTVRFVGHVLNAGGVSAPPAPYEWLLDGHVVASGRLSTSLAAGVEATATFAWTWDPAPHTLELRLAPVGPEISGANDSLSIRTDALALGYWIERSAWNYFQDRQWQYCVPLSCNGSDSFPDWLQRQVSVWNGMLADASYALPSPVSVADRVRVDQIVVVPDGSLPLHGDNATDMPDISDHTVDLEWGLPATGVAQPYRDGNDGKFNVDLGLLEELGHARYLADLYRFDLRLDGSSSVKVLDAAGQPAYDGSDPFNRSRPLQAFYSDAAGLYLYFDAENDIMSCACTRYYSPYDALLLNRLRGRRAQCGNYNAPCNLGDWYADIPAVVRLRLLDMRGRPVTNGTRVRLFFDGGDGLSGHDFVQSDSLTLTTTGSTVRLPADPFRSGGDRYREGRNLLLIEANTPERDAFCFLEPTTLNVAYWLGYRDARHAALITIDLRRIRRNSCNPSLPAARVNDPFGTSVFHSRALYTAGQPGSVAVVLRNDANPSIPMRDRVIVAFGAKGQRLAQGTTDARGDITLRAPERPAQIIDVTDNNLVIPMAGPARQRRAVRRP
jgi:hypothetical protein